MPPAKAAEYKVAVVALSEHETYVMANAGRCTVHPQHVMVGKGRDERMYADRFECACGATRYGNTDENRQRPVTA